MAESHLERGRYFCFQMKGKETVFLSLPFSLSLSLSLSLPFSLFLSLLLYSRLRFLSFSSGLPCYFSSVFFSLSHSLLSLEPEKAKSDFEAALLLQPTRPWEVHNLLGKERRAS